MHKNFKELFPKYVVLIRVGTFYEAYLDDACIIAYIMSYKLRDGNYKSCGFPSNSLNRVLSVLDRKTINYLVLDKSHNYEEEVKEDYKRKNKYDEILTDAKKYIDKIYRIEKIKNHLMLDDSKLVMVEKLLYE